MKTRDLLRYLQIYSIGCSYRQPQGKYIARTIEEAIAP